MFANTEINGAIWDIWHSPAASPTLYLNIPAHGQDTKLLQNQNETIPKETNHTAHLQSHGHSSPPP